MTQDDARLVDLHHKETCCLDILLSALDARAGAQTAGSSMLVYLAELLVQRCREELAAIRHELDRAEPAQSGGGAAR